MAFNKLSLALGILSLSGRLSLASAGGTDEHLFLPRQCHNNPAGPLHRTGADVSCPPAIDDQDPLSSSSRSPWTSRPTCINSTDATKPKLCAYLYEHFRGGDAGLSLLATPDVAASALDTLQDRDVRWVHHAMGRELKAATPPPCLVKTIPGKGRGVVARRKILEGEVLMVEYPLFLRPLDFGRWPANGRDLLRLLNKGGNQLPVGDRWKLMNMARSGEGDMLDDLFNTNSFAVVVGGVEQSGIFPDVAVRGSPWSLEWDALLTFSKLINHACQPK